MAELPEIAKMAGQMDETLKGKTVGTLTLLQEKCANIPQAEFQERIGGANVARVYNRGKWIFTSLSNGENILLSLGMGADVLYFENEGKLPEKFQIKLLFTDGSGYTARFWWFGKFLAAGDAELATEPNTRGIATDPFDKKFTFDYFAGLASGKKTQAKAFLMNQKNVGGIGNMYMHDILFKAGLHPQRKLSDLDAAGLKRLYDAIKGVLEFSRSKGTFAYEGDFFGQKGGYTGDDFLVGYKEGKPCPECGEKIISIKAGGSQAFLCPVCQK
ncbi:MAG: hypothetical protein FWF03_04370 [Defluviitaleaceae bacterium]|nr:hypothetical protein [Defluviitaleaceae bacterium]